MSTTRTFLSVVQSSLVLVGILAGLVFGVSKASAAAVIWDGGGADTKWSTGANWSSDSVPGIGDVALFNASSTTNTLIDVNIQVSGISTESGYMGTITQASNVAVTTGTNGFTLNGGTFTAGGGMLDINDGVTITGSAIFNASTTPIFVSGNWNNSGTFTAGGSTITLDGGNQSIFGSTTFYTLIKNASTTAVTLTFEAGKTQTTLGTLRLTGEPNAYLSLRSSQDGVQYRIDPRGTIVIENVDLKDADNISAAPIDTREKSVLHSGNNTNWIFGSTVSAPGGSFYVIPPPPVESKPQPKPEEKPVPKKEPEPVKEEKKPVSEVKPVPVVKVVPKPAPAAQVLDRKVEAMVISTGDSASIREFLQINRNRGAEERAIPVIQRVFKGKVQLNQSQQTYALINFIAYGGPSTRHLGSGERAGVADSFVAAYGKMPTDAADWEAVISIANGTRPEKRSPQAEWRAEQAFKAVYGRRADMSKIEERQAVDVMAYGLRTAKRNLKAEQQALVKYRKVYNKFPASAGEWDILRTIAYSAITQ